MKLLIIDSNSLMNRAYYGIKYLSASDGTPTNAIYGFMNILLKLIGEEKPDNVIFTFDRKEPTFRHKRFDGYKATRSGMPEELALQFPLIKEIITAWGYPILELAGYEADDIIGTVARENEKLGGASVIVTGDRDSFQLTDENTTIRLATTKVAKGEDLRITTDYIKEKYGVSPKELIDVKGLMGDTSDNIPGVAGIGEKTALALISEFHTIDGVYENIESPSIKKGVKLKLELGKDQALMSRELAEINCEVPLETPVSKLPSPSADGSKIKALLSKLELKTLLKRIEADLGTADTSDISDTDATETEKKPVAQLVPISMLDDLASLAATKIIYVESSFNGRVPTLLSVGTIDDNGNFICYSSQDKADEREEIEKIMTFICDFSKEVCTDHLKELHFYALTLGQSFKGKIYDIEIAAYVLSPLSTDYSTEKLADAMGLPSGQALVSLMPSIAKSQKAEIAASNQQILLDDIELPLAEVLASMEFYGFKLDTEGLRKYGEVIFEEINDIAAEIYSFAGESFNINSPKQLGTILFEKLGLPTRKKTKSGFSTNAEVLDSLKNKHPIIPLILRYRQLSKLHSTYVLGLLSAVGEDGRIHTSFKQKETRTGRISSTEPNLQNIPVRTEKGRELRRFFASEEGKLLVDADYSQIELRVLASIAEDAKMISAFAEGADIHTQTASEVFDMPPELINPILRSRAKAVNFGIVYGIGAFSLSQDIGVTVAEADSYIKNYLDTYPGVRKYMEDIKAFGTENGYVSTLYGRRRPIPELNSSNKVTKALGERVAMNTPIQGTAADIIKLAMIKVYNRLKSEKLSAKLILQVHDELIVECPLDEVEKITTLLTEEMESAAKLAVHLPAEAHSGKNWLEVK